MPRRTFARAKPGQIFASEWIEWHVTCALCEKMVMVIDMSGVESTPEAEQIARTKPWFDDEEGWQRIKGLWYCPPCAKKEKA